MIVQGKEEADSEALPMVNTLGVIKVIAGSEQTNTWPTPIFDQDQIGEFTLAWGDWAGIQEWGGYQAGRGGR